MSWRRAFAEAFTPRPRLSVSEWADRHRHVAEGTGPEPGPWRTSRALYLREPMDAVSDPAVERVVIQAGSQLGKSELLLNLIGFYADADPSPILLVQPTEIAMQAFSKERIEPTFRATPALRGKLSSSLRDKDNTILLKQFPGGYLACAWATSAVSLASRPIRIVLLDEVDRYPDSLGRDGDPIAQAVQRTSNFHNRKIIAVSTPTIDGISKIATAYDDTDQRHFYVPCPRCGAHQVLAWEGVVYKNAAGEVDLADVHYRCEHCKGRIEERDRPWMLARGEWKPDNPGHPHRGYQISALYSPWVRWRELAVEWVRANAARDKQGLQEFVNLRLGETWTEEGDRISVEALEKNREAYEADVPDGVLLLTAGVDVQDNRLEAEILGWGVGRESWGVRYAILPGDTSTPDPWRRLDELLARTWARADGSTMALWCACVDSGGHRTDEVYAFCRDRTVRNVFAIKGRAGAGIPIAGKPTLNKFRAPLCPVGVDTGKEALFSRLALATPGPGYCHFPSAREAGYDDTYFRGLVSEQRRSKMRGGRRVLTWVQTYARNEPLDVRVYATAAMEMCSVDFDALARADEARRAMTPAAARPTAPVRRRVLSRGVEW